MRRPLDTARRARSALALGVALVFVLVSGAGAAQAAPPPREPEVAVTPSLDAVFGESIDVRVINVEVVVTDRRGNRVFGLGPEELRLLVDGEEVDIEYFSELRGGVALGAVGEGPEPSAAPALPDGEAAPTSYLVFVDDVLTLGRDRDRVVRALADGLDRLRPGDRMAVVAYGNQGLEMLTSWTASTRELERVFREIEQRPARGLLRFAAYRTPSGPGIGALGRSTLRLASRPSEETEGEPFRDPRESRRNPREEAWLVRTVDAATAALRAFADPPGRKVMLLLAGGWHLYPALVYGEQTDYPSFADPYRFARIFGPLTDTANLLGYTIYPVDVPGEVSFFGADVGRSSPSGVSPFAVNRTLDDNLRYVAELTGGRPLLDGARLDALPEVIADTASFYWLGFSPVRSRDDRPHRVTVEVVRPGLRVRSRRSYRDLSPLAERTMMVESALLFGGLPATSAIEVTAGAPIEGKRRSMTVPVDIRIPLTEVTALPSGGQWWVPLEVFLAVEDERGRRSQVVPVQIELRRSAAPEAGDVARYRTHLELRRRPHELVVAVHDPLAGRSLFGRTELSP